MKVVGTYRHTLDVKNRLAMPVQFRSALGEVFYCMKGPDKCLFVYDEEGWEHVTAQLSQKSTSRDSRNRQRHSFGGAFMPEPDKQGRFIIPQEMIAYAELKKDVVVFGCDTRIEIWDSEEWDTMMKAPVEGEFDDIIW